MKGSLHELGEGHWRLRVFAGREDGKVRQVSRNFDGTKRQAESALAKLVADVERQEVARATWSPSESCRPVARGHRAAPFQLHRPGVPPHRYKTIKPAIGELRIDKITGRQLDDFYRSLHRKGLANSTVHQHHSVVHAALGRAVKWGLLPTNPADRATPPGRLARRRGRRRWRLCSS